MTKWIVPILVAIAFTFGGSAAFAEVNVLATIVKTKDITVIESLTIFKDLDLDVDVTFSPENAAESEALINQRNQGNKACGNCAEKIDEIIESVNNNNGIVTVNQSSGNMNNQGFALSVALTTDTELIGDGVGNFANSQAAMEQVMGGADVLANTIDTLHLIFRETVLDRSVNNNQGIVTVNQSAGNINNQAVGLSLAISLLGGVGISEADLGQFNTGNLMDELDVVKSAFIGSTNGGGSVNNNQGFTGVNQTSGNFANQAINASFAFATSSGL